MPGPRRPNMAAVLLLVVTSLLTRALASDVNGNWTPWSSLTSSCSKSCDGGTLLKIRTCDNPTPQGQGSNCITTDKTEATIEVLPFECAQEECWETNQRWTEWSDCSNCSVDPHYRYAECGANITCTGAQAKVQTQLCQTWSKPPDCPSPCDPEDVCPKYSVCKDLSNATFPDHRCDCTMGYAMENAICVRPPPTTPTPRPIPTMAPALKVTATAMSKTASTVLIVCVSITLVFFIMMRNFTPDRVIQMNMEISLLVAHLFLLFPSGTSDYPSFCKFVSIMLHFCFMGCFMFMLLESLHMYSLVACVVKKGGMFTRGQNILVGWGMSAFIVLFSMCFVYDEYGGEYHCWLQLDKGVALATQVPMYVMMIATFTLTEAAGSADYKQLKNSDETQLTSAKFSQRTNLILLPLVYIHWLLGVLSEYQQNLALYAMFSTVNAVLGVMVMLLHCSNNEKVRVKLVGLFNRCRGKKSNETKPIKPSPE